MPSPKDFKIKLFADGANINEMKEIYHKGIVKGFTTNPTLMKKSGVSDYKAFAKEAIKAIPDLPISFEVFSDDFTLMEEEAREIAGWGNNVNVKIPITNTQSKSSIPLIRKLSAEGMSLNITAILTVEQVREAAKVISPLSQTIISVLAGRIADTGRDPMPYMRQASDILKSNTNARLLWASSRELLNIFQAQSAGCHIITVTGDILKRIPLIGKDLKELSLDTVKMFCTDASSANYEILKDKKNSLRPLNI
jgi:transaldolase